MQPVIPPTRPFWAKITDATVISITATTTATANRLHLISGTSADYDIPMPTSPVSGDVVGFIVREFSAASKQFRLDATGSVIVAGRTRYLTLLHSNVALFYYDGTRWLPQVLELDTPWVDAGAITITATTTNPTKGTTTLDKVYWRRVGQSLEADYRYRQTAGGTAGSGAYLYALPIGTASSIQPTLDGVGDSAIVFPDSSLSDCGSGTLTNGTDLINCRLHLKTTTTFIVLGVSATLGLIHGVGGLTYANTIIRYGHHVNVPMTDW